MSYTVALYETDRAYGGPEEGGWFYTTGYIRKELFKPITFRTAQEAVEFMKSKQEWVDQLNKGRKPPGSMQCSGWYAFSSYAGDTVPNVFPRHAPAYA